MKNKVLFVLHLPAPIHGAAMVGKYIKESKRINSSFEADYINLTTSTNLKEIGKRGTGKLVNLLKIQVKVIKALLCKKYDLTYMTLTASGAGFYKDLLVVLILKLFRRKILYHFHNKGVSYHQQNWLDDLLYRFAFHNTKSILLSPRLYSDIERYVTKGDVFFCPNGIPQNINLQYDALVTKNTPVCRVLYLSNMMPSKGVFVLLQACSILKEKSLHFECDFVGDWSEISEEEFNKYVATNKLTQHVFAHGKKYGAEKHQFFRNADIFVFPTIYETFGLVNLEAMEFGIPIISTLEGGIPDVIVEGETGFLVSKNNAIALAEKIEILIRNPELRLKMGLAGRKRFNDFFTLDKFEENFSNVLHHAIR